MPPRATDVEARSLRSIRHVPRTARRDGEVVQRKGRTREQWTGRVAVREALAQSAISPDFGGTLWAFGNIPHVNAPLMVSQMLRRPDCACEAFTVSAVISLKSFMCASVAGPAMPSLTSPFFC
jgi:hypothetical protein